MSTAPVTTAYLAAAGYEEQLAVELDRAGLGPTLRAAHGRLFISDAPAIHAAWAINTWFDAVEEPIRSVTDAAGRLRARQRNWAGYTPHQRGRAGLIGARLPTVSARPLELGAPAPLAPLGSWTLLAADRMLSAARCSSPFPNGETRLVERRHGPPSRAYLKLWEAFVRLGGWPAAGDVAVDLGASPGGWTWLLAELGCRVAAVDRAALADDVAALGNVTACTGDAFALDPATLAARIGRPRWVCGDIACYPERLADLAERWRAAPECADATFVLTVKFQGRTDHDAADRLRRLAGARLQHLHHNKHELTLIAPPT